MKKLSLSLFAILLFFSCNMNSINIDNDTETERQIKEIITASDKENHSSLTKTSENSWLMLFYLAGDADYNDSIYKKMTSISKGLYKIQNADGKAKDGYSSVNAIVLWDGYNKNITSTKDKNGKFIPVKNYHPNSMLYKIEPSASSLKYTDLSKEVDFLGTDPVYEINTGSASSLENLLKWSKSKYEYTNVALFLTGEGGGPFGTTVFDTRSCARDISSNNDFLTAPEISEALKNSGFTEENKLDVLFFESQLSSSLEIAYELKNYVKGMFAIPSLSPVYGLEYSQFIPYFKKDVSVYDLGVNAVNLYANYYFVTTINQSQNGIASSTFIDLSKITAIKESLEPLCEELISTKDKKIIKIDDDNFISYFDCLTEKPYQLLNEDVNATIHFSEYKIYNLCTYRITTEKNGYEYRQFFTHDLGKFADSYSRIASNSGNASIYNYALNLRTTVKNAIVCSWRSGKNEEKGSYQIDEKVGNFYGLTIIGNSIRHNESSPFSPDNDDSYFQPYHSTDFKMKNETKWKEILELVKPNQFVDKS